MLEDLNFDKSLAFNFNFKETPAKVLLEVKGLKFGYTEDNILFRDISFTLERGECLGIIGKNGKGKSTLLNTIAGELKHLEGEVNFHPSASLAHFGQTNISHLDPSKTVMDEIYAKNPKLGESAVRAICGGMMFSNDDAKKNISLLSGGEKSRVMLGQILASEINLLLLDEPTNHLDMQSIEALTKAVQKFKGSSIIVTHSEELLRRVCDRLIIFAKGGAEYFDGGYDDFLEKIGWEEDEGEVKKKSAPKTNYKEAKKIKAQLIRERNAQTALLKKEVEKLEKKIIQVEEKLELHHKELVVASEIADNIKIESLSKLISDEESQVEEMFENLELAQTKLDAINEEYEQKIIAI